MKLCLVIDLDLHAYLVQVLTNDNFKKVGQKVIFLRISLFNDLTSIKQEIPQKRSDPSLTARFLLESFYGNLLAIILGHGLPKDGMENKIK